MGAKFSLKSSAPSGWNILFYRSKLCVLGDLRDIDDFFLVIYHNLLSHRVQRLVSGILINCKVQEREQFKHLTRGGGQHSRNESTSSGRGWWEGRTNSRTRSPVARVTDGPGSQHIYLASHVLQESAGLQIPRAVYSAVAKMWDTQFLTSARGTSPVMQIQGLSRGKAAREAREGTEVVIQSILPSLRRRFCELVMLFLFPFQWAK